MKYCLFAYSVLVISLLCTQSLAQGQKPPTRVFVHKVSEQELSNTLQALGTLKANEAITLSSSSTEIVSAIHFNDGQRVKAGDILLVLANSEENALLEKAQHTMKEAEQQYHRVRALVDKNIATQSELDALKLKYDAAKSQLDATRSKLDDLLIVAPFHGVLGLRNISLGALIRPGDVITTLDDDSTMKLDMSVPSTYLPYIQTGMKIVARTHALGGKTFNGTIASIDSRIDPVTRSVQVRALIPNPDYILRPGLLMTVELQEPARNAVLVPEKTLIKNGTETFVFVVSNKKGQDTVEKRAIEQGERLVGQVEITAGLKPGELIVSQGHLKLKHGSKVNISARDNGTDNLQQLLQQAKKNKADQTQAQTKIQGG